MPDPDTARLARWFDEGRLLRPHTGGRATTVDLIRTLVAAAGGPRVPDGSVVVPGVIPAEHLVFVIVDGLGARLLADLCADGFIAGHTADALEAVFPSTTGAAMTAYATGLYPAEHGVPGWWVYLDEHDLTAVSLMCVERFGGADLAALGVAPQALFGPAASVLAAVPRDTAVVTPFVGTAYTAFSAGGRTQVGYRDPDEAFDRTIDRLRAANGPTFTQVYLPQLDGLCHDLGVGDPRCGELLGRIDAGAARLHDAAGDATRIVLSADHGHVDLPDGNVVELRHDAPLMRHLRCPPCGEPTVPMFHVRPGHEAAFADEAAGVLGDRFALLSIDEANALRLFGPTPLSPLARRRIGQFVGICPEPTWLAYVGPAGGDRVLKGVHAGLTPGEMLVPLMIA